MHNYAMSFMAIKLTISDKDEKILQFLLKTQIFGTGYNVAALTCTYNLCFRACERQMI